MVQSEVVNIGPVEERVMSVMPGWGWDLVLGRSGSVYAVSATAGSAAQRVDISDVKLIATNSETFGLVTRDHTIYSSSGRESSPSKLPPLPSGMVAIGIACDTNHIAAIASDGELFFYNGSSCAWDQCVMPAPVRSIVGGQSHMMWITATGRLYGARLEEPDASSTSSVPSAIHEYDDITEPVVAVAAGVAFGTVLTQSGKVYQSRERSLPGWLIAVV
jgi:alpha-tubulin suppressor-like RCC1 family protein